MNIYKNSYKHFNFSVNKYKKDKKNSWNFFHCLKEKYENKFQKELILKYYKNYMNIDDIDIKIDKNINIIKIFGIGELNEEIFDLKENNYSVQEIYLNLDQDCNEKLLQNISRFKSLKKLYLFDRIYKNELFGFIDDILKLKLLDELFIKIYGKFSKDEINSIKKLLPNSSIQKEFEYNKNLLIIRKNYKRKNDDEIFNFTTKYK